MGDSIPQDFSHISSELLLKEINYCLIPAGHIDLRASYKDCTGDFDGGYRISHNLQQFIGEHSLQSDSSGSGGRLLYYGSCLQSICRDEILSLTRMGLGFTDIGLMLEDVWKLLLVNRLYGLNTVLDLHMSSIFLFFDGGADTPAAITVSPSTECNRLVWMVDIHNSLKQFHAPQGTKFFSHISPPRAIYDPCQFKNLNLMW